MKTIRQFFWVILVVILISISVGLVAYHAGTTDGPTVAVLMLINFVFGSIALFFALKPHYERWQFVEYFYAEDERFIPFIRQIATHQMVHDFMGKLARNVAEASGKVILLRKTGASQELIDAAIAQSKAAYEHFVDQRDCSSAGYGYLPTWKQYLGKESAHYTCENGIIIPLKLSSKERQQMDDFGRIYAYEEPASF